jgi:hypothetical protein
MDLQLKISMCISLKKAISRVYALFVLLIENLRIRKQSVLLMIGIGVSVLVTIVINHFNYILISVKVKLKKYISNLSKLLYTTNLE